MDYSPSSSSVHEIFQARILECVAASFSRRSSQPGDRTDVSCIGRWILYHWATIANNVIFNFDNCFYYIIFYHQFPFLSILEARCKNCFFPLCNYLSVGHSSLQQQSEIAQGMAIEKTWTVFNFACWYSVKLLINICNLLIDFVKFSEDLNSCYCLTGRGLYEKNLYFFSKMIATRTQ